MASLSADRPSEVVLAARVARQYYLEGVSKIDIAERLGISRFRVARLLDSARESGLVRIEIGLPGGVLDAGLSAELCSAFGLRQAFVFNFGDDESPLRQRLGEAVGQVLMDLIKPTDVLGLSWSRALSGLTAALTQLPPCPIVQLTGRGAAARRPGPARPGQERGPDRRRARARVLRADAARRRADGGGDPPPGRHRRGVRARPERDHRGGRDRRVGAGAVDDLRRGHAAERSALTTLGVHAELAGVFIGADGRPLGTPLDSRMIVTPAALFTQIPFVLAVAYDAAKSHAVRAAIRGGLVHGLVTHTSLARALLSARGRPRRRYLGRARRPTAASRCAAGPPTGAGSSASATPSAGPPPRAGAPPTRCSTTWPRSASTAPRGCSRPGRPARR